MSPEHANVIIIEDENFFAEYLKETLEMEGHTVVGIARTFKEGESLIQNCQKEQIHAAIIDGNLSRGAKDGTEGQQLAELSRKILPSTKVIAYSGDEQPWSDYPKVTKRTGVIEVSELIKQI